MKIKELIKQMDFFNHTQFLRYRHKQKYQTYTGGIISICIIFLFVGIFFNTMLNTLEKKIIISSQNRQYQLDPTYYEIKANAQSKFVFAIGLKSLDLSSKKQYFTVKVDHQSLVKNGSTSIRQQTLINMIPCTIDMWNGINDQITTTFYNFEFNKWLCPDKDFLFTFEGKYSSQKFKYFRIFVEKCVASNTTECATETEVNQYFTQNQGGTVFTYFVNSVINPTQQQYITSYIQDSNYFSFTATTGVTSNIFFNQYQINTDNSLFPIADYITEKGLTLKSTAYGQPYPVTSNGRYAKLYVRKSDSNIKILRQFQKYDQTLSFIGGLYSTIILLLFVIGTYNKYSYQIEFGDRFFKRDNNTSYGSQSFNLINFIGYCFYKMCIRLGWQLKWQTMKTFHQCRQQTIKQLDFHLLMKKIEHFEKVSWLVLEQHHLKGLYLLPRRTFKEVKNNRKRYMMQTIIYHQLQRKGRLVNIQKQVYKNKCQQFMQAREKAITQDNFNKRQQKELNLLYSQFGQSYQQILQRSKMGDDYSRRIMQRIQFNDIWKSLFQMIKMKFIKNQNSDHLNLDDNIKSSQQLVNTDDGQQFMIIINAPQSKQKRKGPKVQKSLFSIEQDKSKTQKRLKLNTQYDNKIKQTENKLMNIETKAQRQFQEPPYLEINLNSPYNLESQNQDSTDQK